MIYVGEAVAKRTVESKVQERVKGGKCLVCEDAADYRGLCHRHYRLFLRLQKERDSKQQRAEFEQSAIRDGLILAPGFVRDIKRENPFASLG